VTYVICARVAELYIFRSCRFILVKNFPLVQDCETGTIPMGRGLYGRTAAARGVPGMVKGMGEEARQLRYRWGGADMHFICAVMVFRQRTQARQTVRPWQSHFWKKRRVLGIGLVVNPLVPAEFRSAIFFVNSIVRRIRRLAD
jgi:hypothetical protein